MASFNKDKQIHYYESLLGKHGDHFLSLDWKSKEGQELRFKIFNDLIGMTLEKKSFSVLDIGCGFADLFGFLKKRGHKFSYQGYDLSDKIIENAKKRYPEAKVEVRNIMENPPPHKFDYVFCSGIFNISFEKENHMEFVHQMLLRMFDYAEIGVCVNFLSSNALAFVDEKDIGKNQYFYFKPEELVNFCNFITHFYILRHDYHPGDFSIYMLKQ